MGFSGFGRGLSQVDLELDKKAEYDLRKQQQEFHERQAKIQQNMLLMETLDISRPTIPAYQAQYDEETAPLLEEAGEIFDSDAGLADTKNAMRFYQIGKEFSTLSSVQKQEKFNRNMDMLNQAFMTTNGDPDAVDYYRRQREIAYKEINQEIDPTTGKPFEYNFTPYAAWDVDKELTTFLEGKQPSLYDKVSVEGGMNVARISNFDDVVLGLAKDFYKENPVNVEMQWLQYEKKLGNIPGEKEPYFQDAIDFLKHKAKMRLNERHILGNATRYQMGIETGSEKPSMQDSNYWRYVVQGGSPNSYKSISNAISLTPRDAESGMLTEYRVMLVERQGQEYKYYPVDLPQDLVYKVTKGFGIQYGDDELTDRVVEFEIEIENPAQEGDSFGVKEGQVMDKVAMRNYLEMKYGSFYKAVVDAVTINGAGGEDVAMRLLMPRAQERIDTKMGMINRPKVVPTYAIRVAVPEDGSRFLDFEAQYTSKTQLGERQAPRVETYNPEYWQSLYDQYTAEFGSGISFEEFKRGYSEALYQEQGIIVK